MVSHTEYIADQSEDQLRHLIEVSQQKLDAIKNGGWVYLWVVSDYANQAWFLQGDYVKAIDCFSALAKKHIADGKSYDMEIKQERFRQSEVDELVKC